MRQILTKQESGFVQIKNSVISELPCELLGLYVYIYSKPDDWDFSAYRIATDLKMHRNTCEKYIKQLEELGYIERERLSTGKMNYYINHDKKPLLKKDTVIKTHSDRIVPISNTESKQTKKDNKYISSSVEEVEEDFNSNSYIEEMTENTQKHIRLIGFFFQEKGFKFDTKAQVQESIKANVAVARTLTKIFSTEDIRRAILWSKEVCPDSWTIHTIKKGLTTNKSKVDNYKLYD